MASEQLDGEFLPRKQAAEFLTEYGFKTSAATLSKWACWGPDGPPFHRWGRLVVYEKGDLLDWARSKLSPAFATTSAHEDEVQRRKASGPKTAAKRRSKAEARRAAA